MTRLMQNSVSFRDVTSLLDRYGFESAGQSIRELVELWDRCYPSHWLRLAVIEALYQGRYKTVSVEQILAAWKRRGHALYHFNHEFERLVGRKEPQTHGLLPACLNSSLKSEVKVTPDSSYLVDRSSPLPNDSAILEGNEPEGDRNLLSTTDEETEHYLCDYVDEISSITAYPEWNALELSSSEAISIEETNKRTIDRFTPKSDRSEVYLKLMVLSGDASR